MSIFICSFCKCNIASNKNIYYAHDYNYCSAECRLNTFIYKNKKPASQSLVNNMGNYTDNYTDNYTYNTCSSIEDYISISELHHEISNNNSYNADVSNTKLDNFNQEFKSCVKISSYKSVKNLTVIDSIPERSTYKNFRDCNTYFDYSLSLLVYAVNAIYNIE